MEEQAAVRAKGHEALVLQGTTNWGLRVAGKDLDNSSEWLSNVDLDSETNARAPDNLAFFDVHRDDSANGRTNLLAGLQVKDTDRKAGHPNPDREFVERHAFHRFPSAIRFKEQHLPVERPGAVRQDGGGGLRGGNENFPGWRRRIVFLFI